VLYVLGNLWLGVRAGGSVGHVAGVVNALIQAGYDVDFVTGAQPVMISPAVTVFRVQPRPLGIPLEANYYSFQRDLLRCLTQAKSGRDYRFLYYRLSIASYLGVPLANALGLPLVAEYNGSEAWAARNWGSGLRYEGLARLSEDVTLRQADVVVTVSDVLRRELVARGVNPARIAVHPNAVDPAIFAPGRLDERDRVATRNELAIPGDRLVITFVGTFGRWHGVDVFATAIRTLIRDQLEWLQKHRVHFLLVGDGLMMPEARKIIGGRATHGLVTFAGLVRQEATPRYLSISDILVSPHVPNPDGTDFFGSPTKLFEYMSMGGAIVASDLGQIGEIIRPALRASSPPRRQPGDADAEVGVLAKPGDADELIAGLRFLVENPSWRTALGRHARTRVLSRYTWRHHVEAILERLEAVASLPRDS
jgi:glycosyltransferase involved in cell wall biosynthesis